MSRTYFSYQPPFRATRGGVVIDLQKGLAKAGDFPLSVDGVFANQTVQAIKLWQNKSSIPVTGQIDDLTWLGLTQSDSPTLFRRCLGLTAAFEGQGYALAVGNFDGAGLTWGIVGFTLVTGDLGKVLKAINQKAPQSMATAFGDKLPELMGILDRTKPEKIAWANSLSLGSNKSALRPDWRDAFEQLGNQEVARGVQDEVAHDDYWKRAVADMRAFGKLTELDAALFFDTAVQSGGVNREKADAIKAALATSSPTASNRDRLKLIATAVATGVQDKYHQDVVDRRTMIASGQGVVHGAEYIGVAWGIDDISLSEYDLL